MAALVQVVLPPRGFEQSGKKYYQISKTLFTIDAKYIPIKPIGKGSYGAVCSAYDRETNEKVAIKKISNLFSDASSAVRTLREMMILRQLRHDNIISLKDVMLSGKRTSFREAYLVYELMDTDLHRIIRSQQPLSQHQIQYFVFQILCGLRYLHSANVLHRDLKPANILVNYNCDLKICDFGLARTAARSESEFMTEYVVTRWYRAPELLLSAYNYGPSIDVWSVGCIFAELLGRKPIFPGTSSLNQLYHILNVLGTQKGADLAFIQSPRSKDFIESLPQTSGIPFSSLFPLADPLCLDLLEKMLMFNPDKRITVIEALQHPYMAGLYDPEIHSPSQLPVKVDVEEGMKDNMIRESMWDEMLYYHPGHASLNNH